MTVELRAIDQGQGRERAFSLQHPEALETLIQIARIQSVESSNAIEDLTAPHARVVELVEQKTTPANRSEAEIAGYRDVLDRIHANALQIPFKPSVVEQFHRDLYQFTFDSSRSIRSSTAPDVWAACCAVALPGGL
jgi:hypothetical protein